jgi:hypothetical protein
MTTGDLAISRIHLLTVFLTPDWCRNALLRSEEALKFDPNNEKVVYFEIG